MLFISLMWLVVAIAIFIKTREKFASIYCASISLVFSSMKIMMDLLA